MYVLHAIWNCAAKGTLDIWAETSSAPIPKKKSAGRQTKKPKFLPHPFAIPPAELRNVVSEIAGSLIGESPVPGLLTLDLPTMSNQPVASPQLIRNEEESQNSPKNLQPWEIPTLRLDPGTTLDFLLALPHQPPPGIAFGDSVVFWAELVKLALEFIIQQRFFPSLKPNRSQPESFQATWVVYLSENDAVRVDAAAKALPPVCRAVHSDDGTAQFTPIRLVLDFLNQVTDHFVRSALQAQGMLNQADRIQQKQRAPVDEWLRALTSDDPVLHLRPKELDLFIKDLNTWLEQIRPKATVAPFRTCFRLEPPDEEHPDQNRWRISFHLQATDDRSLMVPAQKIWAHTSADLTFLKRKFENPQERLLADLARAARLFPAIEASLRTVRPSMVKLDTQEAYQFLRQNAPLLEQSGFGVLLPNWWQKPAIQLGVKLVVRAASKAAVAGESTLGIDSLVNYNWQIALGNDFLSPEEFEKLASLKVPLVKVRGQWVELKPEEIEKAIAFFKQQQGAGEMSLQKALRIGLGGDPSEIGLKVLGLEAEGWVKEMLAALTDGVKIKLLETPVAFQGQLRPYQSRGFSWLVFLQQFGFGACLADDMGLGKTIQFIAFYLYNRKYTGTSRPSLIISPMSVVGNWHKELQRFAPSLKILVHHGPERLTGKNFVKKAKQHDIVISTYALAYRDLELFTQLHWDCLVLDEAQNIKNSSAKQTQAVRQLEADFRLALTGTPVENRLAELWSIMEFLNSGYLGSATDFRSKFAVPIERYRNHDRAQTLKNLIQPFVLRRLKTDPLIIQDLPAKNEMKIFSHLTVEQASLYEAVVKEMLEKIEDSEGIQRKGLVLATLTKLKQVCNHPAHLLQDGSELAERSGKLIRLREMLEEVLAESDKALIFTQFTQMGTMLHHDLQTRLGIEILFLHGGTIKKQRDNMVQRFQSANGPPIFILSLKAGGVGLNLTAANHVFHFDRWWNPAVENQATDRVFRIGQKKNVQVFKFICLGTLEERIDQMIENKKELADHVVGTGESWLTELSTSQLRELFTLNREVVVEE